MNVFLLNTMKKAGTKFGLKKLHPAMEELMNEGNFFNTKLANEGEDEYFQEYYKLPKDVRDKMTKEDHWELRQKAIKIARGEIKEPKEIKRDAEGNIIPDLTDDKISENNGKSMPQLDSGDENNNKPYPELFDEDIESKKEEVFKEIEKFNNSKEDVLYKDNDNITQQEIDDALVYGNYENDDKGLKNEINDKASSWYDNIFGGDSAAKDETGKTMDIMPQKEPSTEPSELSTSDGMSIMDGFKGIASSVANFGVEALQGALNSMPSNRPQLKTDGIVGPKTVSRTKEALARQGLATTQRNIGATSFSQMMQQNKGKSVDTSKLNGIVQKIDPQNGATALQKGINTIGQAISGYDKIKEDGIVGPKTTEAFNKIKDGNEDELKTVFAPQQDTKENPYQKTEMERYFSAQIR